MLLYFFIFILHILLWFIIGWWLHTNVKDFINGLDNNLYYLQIKVSLSSKTKLCITTSGFINSW